MLSTLFLFSALPFGLAAPPPISLNIDFPAFLSRADPVYNWQQATGPTEWVKSLFGGNGELGFLLWQPSPHLLHIELSRQTVYDDRAPSLGSPRFLENFVFDQPRLPIGHFEVSWAASPITAGAGRLSLFNARAELNVTYSSNASLSLAVWACAAWDTAADVVVVEAGWAGGGAGSTPSILWVPDPALSTWTGRDARYVPNPPPFNASAPHGATGGTLNTTTQPHLLGTAHTTAVLRMDDAAPGGGATLFAAVSPVLRDGAAADAFAVAQVEGAAGLGLPALRAAHEGWWHGWWPRGGFATFEYSILEAFFFIQLYKFGSGARAGRTVHDLEGPWFIAGTDWPDLHWDLNLQYPYYLPVLLNRPDISSTLADFMLGLHTSGALAGNVPPSWAADSSAAPTGASSLSGEMSCYWSYGPNCTTSPPSVTGNLLWTLSVIHYGAEVSGNDTIDTDIVWPILGRALQFHSHFAAADGEGVVHLAPTFSPEYPGPVGPDANYDVSLFRWGLQLALDLADRYGLTSPHLPAWAATLKNMTWFPIDGASDTLEIYRGTPYGTPHRHFSHLFSIWPLHLLDMSNASQYETARNSINRWLATPEEDSMFYRPAASAMNVHLGQLAAAFDNVTYLMHHRIEGSTFYREGAQGSCTETPYAAAWAVGDWFLSSWNLTLASTPSGARVIDVYPGVADVIQLDGTPYESAPSRVATAAFWRLGAFGGVLVSGARALVAANASSYVTRTSFVAVEAPLVPPRGAGPIVVRTNMARPLAASPQGTVFTELGDGGLVQLNLPPGGGAVLYSTAFPVPDFSIEAAAGCPAEFNHWGLPDNGAFCSLLFFAWCAIFALQRAPHPFRSPIHNTLYAAYPRSWWGGWGCTRWHPCCASRLRHWGGWKGVALPALHLQLHCGHAAGSGRHGAVLERRHLRR